MSCLRVFKIVFILLLISTFSHAQDERATAHCGAFKSRFAGKVTVVDPAEEDYDMKYVKLNLTMDNVSTYISGDATTIASVAVPSLSAYVFELTAPLIIDSVFADGVRDTFLTTSGDAHTLTLPAALSMGTLFTVKVYYHGTTVTGGGPFAGTVGLNAMVSPSWGTHATFSLSESYHAKEWWPTKQSLHDKIDSADIWITVADSLKAGSNGLLKAITPIDATHNRYEWKERYPIDYYLISVAVAPYIDYSYYMHFTGSTDSMLVQNYVYNNPGTLPAFQSIIDSTGMMIDYFSQLYGRYPFWQEKYGHCMARLSGGMEHQTMTTLGYFEGTLVAHELAHQWFGDNATCGTWADIFMNEGSAAYSEYLYIDHFWSHAQALSEIQDVHTNVKSTATGTVFVDDTTSENRIFDSRLSYDKGAALLHMLRFVINDDSTFFRVYRAYQVQMHSSTGTIMDFKNTAETYLGGAMVNGINLDTFFNQWAYLEGYPIYNITWNQVGSDVYIQLGQTTAVPASVPLFTIPMEIKLHSAAGDTVVRFVNDQASQLLHFTWDNTMLSMATDPNFWLLYKLNSITHDVTLDQQQLQRPTVKISPNPASATWQVTGLSPNSSLALTDISGRIFWQTNTANAANATIPATGLTAGLYLLKVTGSNGAVNTYKLVKE